MIWILNFRINRQVLHSVLFRVYKRGLQLSWLERISDKDEVRGSSPRRPTNSKKLGLQLSWESNSLARNRSQVQSLSAPQNLDFRYLTIWKFNAGNRVMLYIFITLLLNNCIIVIYDFNPVAVIQINCIDQILIPNGATHFLINTCINQNSFQLF